MSDGLDLVLPLGEAAETFQLEKAVCSHGLFMMAPNQWPLSKTQVSRMLRLSETEERAAREFRKMCTNGADADGSFGGTGRGCSGLLRCLRTWSSAFSSATASELLTFNFLFSYILTTTPIPPAIANATKSSASILVLILNCCKGWSLWKRLPLTRSDFYSIWNYSKSKKTLNFTHQSLNLLQYPPSVSAIRYLLSTYADAVSKNHYPHLFWVMRNNSSGWILEKKNWDYYVWPFIGYTEINLLFIKG